MVLMALLCQLPGLYAQKTPYIDKKYSPEALQEDSKVLKDVVLKMHPVIGIYKPREFYEKLFNDLIASLKDSLTEKDYRIRLKLIFEELHCGHSEVMLSKAYSRAIRPLAFNYLPYYFVPLQNKLYVAIPVNKKRDSLLKPFTEVVKINNIKVDSILNYTHHFFTTDGFITSGKDFYLRNSFSYFYPSLFGRPDSFLVEYKTKEEIHSSWLKAVKTVNLPPLPLLPKEDSAYTRYRKANMSVGYLGDNKNALVLKIKSFKHSRYKKVYRKVFRQLKDENIENLVLDLRYNGGGSLVNSYRLLSYLLDSTQTVTLKTHIKKYPLKRHARGNLTFKFTRFGLRTISKRRVSGDTVFYTQKIKPNKKHHYNKNLYVLINDGTFSASCIVSAYLQESGRAKFIGSETSGAKEGCNAGITPYYTLPNTKIKARIPAFRIIHDINPELTGHGILPDYPVSYDIESLLKRKDLELDKVKKLIKNH